VLTRHARVLFRANMSVAGQTLNGMRTKTGTALCQCRSPTHRTQLRCRAGRVLSAANVSAHMRQHGTRHMHLRRMCCNSTEQDNAKGGNLRRLHTEACSYTSGMHMYPAGQLIRVESLAQVQTRLRESSPQCRCRPLNWTKRSVCMLHAAIEEYNLRMWSLP
jgi:hypothetical protein